MAVLLVSMDLFALATVPAGPDEAGGPPPTKFYRRRDNVRHTARTHLHRRSAALAGKLTIDQTDKTQRPRDRADHRQPRERCQSLIISPKDDPSDAFGTVTAVHLQGELQSASWTGFVTPTIPASPDGKPRIQRGFLIQALLSPPATRRVDRALLTDVGQIGAPTRRGPSNW
jgi:hypothetical protein